MDSVSYLLPIKNGEIYLNSVFDYFEGNFNPLDQIIFVNDASTDGTLEALSTFSNKHSHWNIKLVNGPGTGIVNALNIGVMHCDNKWIARFDIDDTYVDGRIEIQRSFLTDNVAAVFCDYELHFPNGRIAGFIPSPIQNVSVLLSLPFSQQTPHPGVIFNKQKFLEVGSYSENDYPIEDLGLWFRLAQIGELISVPKTLLSYRVSNYGTIGSKRELARDKREALISDLEPIWSIIIKNISDIPKLYSELDVFPRSFERKLLFIRNAKYWRKRGYVIPGVTKHENVSLLLLIISNFHNLISLIYFQGLRKIYRTKIN
jgi:O86/O127-antigen biosynthesis beta-1,3-galactosyltransferase